MTESDRIGSHGEFVFQALIGRMCRKKFYFHPIHMGEKHPIIDMVVELHDPTNVQSMFYVQVKSTTLGYTGTGIDERLRVEISSSDIEQLKKSPGPTYIAGIDIKSGRGYLAGIVSTMDGGISGLPTRHPIDCTHIRRLWTEVDTYWNTDPRPMPMTSTIFGI